MNPANSADIASTTWGTPSYLNKGVPQAPAKTHPTPCLIQAVIMSDKPDFTTDFSGPYPRPRLIPGKKPDTQAAESSAEDSNGQQPQQQQQQLPSGASAARSHLWYEETTVVPDAFRKLLIEYSHIPPDEVDEHVIRVVSPMTFLPSSPVPKTYLPISPSATKPGPSTLTPA